MRPSFLFFRKGSGGEINVDFADPLGHHVACSLPKLKGLATYADEDGGWVLRVDAAPDNNGSVRSVNPQSAEGQELLRTKFV